MTDAEHILRLRELEKMIAALNTETYPGFAFIHPSLRWAISRLEELDQIERAGRRMADYAAEVMAEQEAAKLFKAEPLPSVEDVMRLVAEFRDVLTNTQLSGFNEWRAIEAAVSRLCRAARRET